MTCSRLVVVRVIYTVLIPNSNDTMVASNDTFPVLPSNDANANPYANAAANAVLDANAANDNANVAYFDLLSLCRVS